MLTVSHLIDSFDAALRVLVSAGAKEEATRTFYRYQHKKLRKAAGDVPADALRPYHLPGVKFTNAFVRALKSLYRWAADEELIPKDPFRKLKTPRCGQRRRVLTREEMARLYRCSSRPMRRLLFLARYTMARPKELRELRWSMVRLDSRVILLTRFKSQDQRGDGADVRRIPLAVPAVRMLRAIWEKQGRPEDGYVFVNRRGRPWTKEAVRSAMRRARDAAQLGTKGGERIVCYTIRHTAATEATKNGVRDRLLADIMGHTSTRTTARYQHLDAEALVTGIDQAVAPRRKAR